VWQHSCGGATVSRDSKLPFFPLFLPSSFVCSTAGSGAPQHNMRQYSCDSMTDGSNSKSPFSFFIPDSVFAYIQHSRRMTGSKYNSGITRDDMTQ